MAEDRAQEIEQRRKAERIRTPARTRPVQRAPLETVAAEAEVPIIGWTELVPEFLNVTQQGQHIVTLGKTGLGKSTFSFAIANLLHEQKSAACCAFVTKKRDDTAKEQGWPIIRQWPPSYQIREDDGRCMLWPPYTRASTYAKDVRPVFLEALDEIMEEGGWVLYLDESSYLVESLHLRSSVDELFTQSRSNDITLIAGSQRPVWVSRAMVSQHTWVACFAIGDMDDARRAGEVLGDRDRFTPVVYSLAPHQFLFVNTTTRSGVVSQVAL